MRQPPGKIEKYCNVIYVWDMVPHSNEPGALASMVSRHVLSAIRIADELLMRDPVYNLEMLPDVGCAAACID